MKKILKNKIRKALNNTDTHAGMLKLAASKYISNEDLRDAVYDILDNTNNDKEKTMPISKEDLKDLLESSAIIKDFLNDMVKESVEATLTDVKGKLDGLTDDVESLKSDIKDTETDDADKKDTEDASKKKETTEDNEDKTDDTPKKSEDTASEANQEKEFLMSSIGDLAVVTQDKAINLDNIEDSRKEFIGTLKDKSTDELKDTYNSLLSRVKEQTTTKLPNKKVTDTTQTSTGLEDSKPVQKKSKVSGLFVGAIKNSK